MYSVSPDVIVCNIEALCVSRGCTVSRMLSDCELGKSVVDNLKKGSMPSVDKLSKIAEYFGVSTDYLLGRVNLGAQDDIGNNEHRVQMIARKTKELPEADREALLTLLDSTVDTFLQAKGKGKPDAVE